MKRRILHTIKLTEISGVDRPCQEGARVTIMKRAPEEGELDTAPLSKRALEAQLEAHMVKFLHETSDLSKAVDKLIADATYHVTAHTDGVLKRANVVLKWDESEHPRDQDGQFTDGGGASSSDKPTDKPAPKNDYPTAGLFRTIIGATLAVKGAAFVGGLVGSTLIGMGLSPVIAAAAAVGSGYYVGSKIYGVITKAELALLKAGKTVRFKSDEDAKKFLAALPKHLTKEQMDELNQKLAAKVKAMGIDIKKYDANESRDASGKWTSGGGGGSKGGSKGSRGSGKHEWDLYEPGNAADTKRVARASKDLEEEFNASIAGASSPQDVVDDMKDIRRHYKDIGAMDTDVTENIYARASEQLKGSTGDATKIDPSARASTLRFVRGALVAAEMVSVGITVATGVAALTAMLPLAGPAAAVSAAAATIVTNTSLSNLAAVTALVVILGRLIDAREQDVGKAAAKKADPVLANLKAMLAAAKAHKAKLSGQKNTKKRVGRCLASAQSADILRKADSVLTRVREA